MKNLFRQWQIALLLMFVANLAQAASTLNAGEQLYSDQYLASDNAKYRFYVQGDGNLVVRDWATRASLWSSGTHGEGGVRLSLQGDGNLVLRTNSGSAVWSSKTAGTSGERLAMQDDGNLVLYSSSGNSLWSSGTSVGSGGGDSDGGSDNGTDSGSDAMVSVLQNIKAANGTIILDWDSTIDIDSDYTVGRTAPRWLNAFAEAGVDAWLVTGNGNRTRIEAAVMAAVGSENESYWRTLLRNKAYYVPVLNSYLFSHGRQTREEIYEMIELDAVTDLAEKREVASALEALIHADYLKMQAEELDKVRTLIARLTVE